MSESEFMPRQQLPHFSVRGSVLDQGWQCWMTGEPQQVSEQVIAEVRRFGTANRFGARIPLASDLCLAAWEQCLDKKALIIVGQRA